MALQEIGEWFVRSLLQSILEVIGYWTARIVVPILSMGRVRVEDLLEQGPSRRSYWTLSYRNTSGQRVMFADHASGLGVILWLTAFACFVAYRYMK